MDDKFKLISFTLKLAQFLGINVIHVFRNTENSMLYSDLGSTDTDRDSDTDLDTDTGHNICKKKKMRT